MGAHDLPPARDRLIGRDGDLRRLGEIGGRLVTIVGPPGVGKSRLARHAVPDGAFARWIDATGLRSGESLRSALRAAFEVPASGDLASAVASRGPAWLVIDAAERLDPDAREILAALTDAAPALTVLVTSVARLGLDGERAIELAPLSEADAVALFEERARAVGAAPADRKAVEALVARLDRIPLAIELAAARSRVLSPRQLLDRLPSLRGPVSVAWELLDAPERDALARCSVFRGGFDLEAAEAVLGSGAVDRLQGLRDRSLLQHDGERFSMLEAVRERAAEHLSAIGGREEAEAAHARFYVVAGEQRATRVGTREDVDVLRWLGMERANLVAAFDHAPEADLAARAALVLHLVLALQGPTTRAAELLDAALSGVKDSLLRARLLRCRADIHLREDGLDRARACLDEALGMRALPATIRAQLLCDSGRLRARQGECDRARAELREAIALHAAADQTFLEGFSWNGLGTVEEAAGQLDAAATAFERALQLFRRCGNQRMQGVALTNLAVVRVATGRPGDAQGLLEEATDLLRRAQDRSGEAAALVNLGHVHLVAGRLDEAEEALRAGLALERLLGQRDFEGIAQGNLGLVAALRGELRTARSTLQQTLARLSEAGHLHLHAAFLPFFAAVEAALGQPEEARADFAAAAEEVRRLSDRRLAAVLHVLEGFLDLLGPGDPDARAQAARARLPAASTDGDVRIASRLLQAALDRQEPATAAPSPETARGDGIVVGPEAAWFTAGGERVDLTRRGPMRRVLQALVERRLLAPGAGLDAEALFAAGWPGEKALPEAAANRVYAAVRTLRTLGLGSALRRQDDGYLLDPNTPVRWSR